VEEDGYVDEGVYTLWRFLFKSLFSLAGEDGQ
jgi:hypothetical protein